jgi:hypothetical protein
MTTRTDHAPAAVVIEAGEPTKTFTAADFCKVMDSSSFVGAVSFWWALERLAADRRLRGTERQLLACGEEWYGPHHGLQLLRTPSQPAGINGELLSAGRIGPKGVNDECANTSTGGDRAAIWVGAGHLSGSREYGYFFECGRLRVGESVDFFGLWRIVLAERGYQSGVNWRPDHAFGHGLSDRDQ